LEHQVQAPEVAIRYQAAQDAEVETLAFKEKLLKEINEIKAKGEVISDKERGRLVMLSEEIAKVPQLKKRLEELNEARGLGLFARARSLSYGADKAFRAYIDAADDMGTQVGGIVTKSLKGMEDALTSFSMTGKMDFKSLANSIISDMVRMQVQASVTKPLAVLGNALISSLFPTTVDMGAISGGSAWTQTALGNVFNHPSVNALSGGIYNQPTYFQFARGGVLGEAGYEAVMPLKRGRDGKLGVSGGGAPNVILNITNASGTPVSAKQTGPAAFDGDNYIVSVLLEAVENNPTVRGALVGALR
jgi:lambda family phage tail tape measure protein